VDDPADIVRTLLTAIPVGTERAHTGELQFRLDQVGEGYASQTDAVAEAMVLAARTEGVVLDRVYTGRALAGLAAAVDDGSVRPGTRTVFLHTGGLPELFGDPEAVARASVETDRRPGIVLPSPTTE
jgi:L-cysteate sulfo-lyase